MFKSIAKAVKTVSEKADIAGTLGAGREFAAEKLDSGKAAAAAAFEEHWSMVEKVLVDGLLGLAEDRLRSEDALRTLVEGAYELLPFPVRVFLSRERFAQFSLCRREALLLKVEAAKKARPGTETPAPAASDPK